MFKDLVGKINRKTITIVVIVLFAVIIGIIGIAVANSGINVGDYIVDEVEFNGYSGYAYISPGQRIIDYKGILEDLDMLTGNGEMDYSLRNLDNTINSQLLNNCFQVEFDKSNKLSNGNEVTVTITPDYTSLNRLGFDKKFKGKDVYTKTFTVSDRPELTVIDPFSVIGPVLYDLTRDKTILDGTNSVELTFGEFTIGNSISSSETVGVYIKNADGVKICNLGFKRDSNSFATSNKVTITALCDKEEAYAEKGIKISPTVKEYTPITCDYIKKSSEINATNLNLLKEKSMKEFEKLFPDIEYRIEKAYFSSIKDGATKLNYGYTNQVIFVYSFSSGTTGETLYKALTFKNVKNNSDGSLHYVDNLTAGSGLSQKSLEEIDDLIAPNDEHTIEQLPL